jgi:ribosome-binding factor A
MPTRRQRRVNALLLEELSILLPNRVDDERLADVRVTRVDTTQDMTTAKVYVTCYGDDEASAAMLAALEHAKGFLRSQLSDLGLPRIPNLVFARDRGFESGERVLRLLDEMAHDESDGPDEAPPDEEG